MTTEEPKKKRRQNVACSCCKLRRIKCDLQDILVALPSSSSSPPPPLNVLVEQNPDIECSNCKRKGLKCDTQGIREPTKPNKGGKRIDEARKIYGGDGPRRSSEASESVQGVDDIGSDPLEFFDSHPFFPSQLPNSTPLPTSHATGNTASQSQSQNADQASSTLFDPSVLESLAFPITALPSENQSTNDLFPPPPIITTQPPAPTFISTDTPNTAPGTFQEAASIWRQFADYRKGAMQHVQATGQTPRAHLAQLAEADHIWDQGLQDRVTSTINHMKFLAEASEKTGGGTFPTSEWKSIEDLPDPFNARSNLPILDSSVPTPSSFDHLLTPQNLLGLNDYLKQGDSRKRSRSPFSDDHHQLDSRKMFLLAENPWKLWSEDQEQARRQMISWGRREAVFEQLADRALGMALSNHLVKVFFQAVHLSYPAISPEAFYLEWAKAGQRSDRMTPAQEALCAVIEAWGARYSDSPVVRHAAPTQYLNHSASVIQADGTFTPGTRARTHWGKSRITACKALLKRAKRLIDENGVFTNPSITGVQALTLYNQALHMTDQQVVDKDHWLQSRMIHSIITEQMQLLGLIRLFWTNMVSDAFFAASIGQLPKIPQEDVDAAGEWIETVQERLPNSTFKLLAFFLQMNHRLGLAGREVAIKLAYPSRKKGAADIDKICNAVRKIWRDVFHANLRLCCPFLLLVMHQLIRDLLDFWKTLPVVSASITTPSDSTSHSSPSSSSSGQQRSFVPGMRNIELLERLSRESVDGLLANCRSHIGMLKSILPTGVIQSASILLRVLMSMAQLLSEVPTNEQGYPSSTPGGYGWTWETKQKSVDTCLEALHQVGWAWADVGPICDSVALTMERLTPSQEEIAAWQTKNHASPSRPSTEIVRAKEEDEKASEQAVKSVLAFWPPTSVPQLIENAMRRNPTAILNGLMDMGRNTPPNSQYQSSTSLFGPQATSTYSAEHDPLKPVPIQSQNDPNRSIIGNVVGAVQFGDNMTRYTQGTDGQSILDNSYTYPYPYTDDQQPDFPLPFPIDHNTTLNSDLDLANVQVSKQQTRSEAEMSFDDPQNMADLQDFLNQKSDRFMEFYQFPAQNPHIPLDGLPDAQQGPRNQVEVDQTYDQVDVEAFLNELGIPQEPIFPLDNAS
uniref:Zn(2)-C6 fungal-type domain-containing protein n=1 Tax=Kwoniella dejecticola CBS 10117 TaxID=1296121 RepID=A0A1A6AHF0_9TREE|nr:uncharacterized protein I303_01328 [Kwoniella dejecticola CBS 10117]OBR89500.1 hypothetical protein I303_01328 [Kwoniella dejecticola CBS 10117]